MISVINSNSISLEGKDLKRTVPIKDYDYNFTVQFDFSTLFYDVFHKDDYIIFIGPPLNNLKDFLQGCDIYVNSILVSEGIEIYEKPMVSRCLLKFDKSKLSGLDIITLKSKDFSFELSTQINSHESSFFSNSKCLLTLSKDNELVWIIDWLQFHIDNHGIDSVLFYDNNSNQYTEFELAEALSKVKGLKKAIIVPWDYKYGPTKTKEYYFHYCQYAMLEHARLRFLSDAEFVINIDIDELVVTSNNMSISSILDEHSTPGIQFSGRWVEPICLSKDETRHRNYFFQDADSNEECPSKWIVRPKMIEKSKNIFWFVHGINENNLTSTTSVYYLHFKAINTGWKNNRNFLTASNLIKIIDLEKAFLNVSWIK